MKTFTLAALGLMMTAGLYFPAQAETPNDKARSKQPKTVIKTSKVTVPYLGVASTALPAELREQMDLPQDVGLLIRFVQTGSAAAEAGLKPHDVLHKFDNQILINHHQMRTLIRMKKPGDKVELDLFRKGKPIKLEVALGAKQMLINDRLQPIGDAKDGIQMQRIPLLDLKNQRVWVFPGDQRKHLKQLREKMTEAGLPAEQIDQIVERRKKMFERLNNMQWHRLREGEDGRFHIERNRARPAPNNARMNLNFNNQSTMTYNDGEHSLTITVQDAHKTLVARESNGGLIFEGPINTDEQRQALPEPIRQKLDKLEKQVKIEMRIQRMQKEKKDGPVENKAEQEPKL
ncbi:MAG: PDZ domain-containing protein [Phycisphaeraceae bacterium]|nr:PDZ domain-containing protein [Phycisphaeraceae bacterium]